MIWLIVAIGVLVLMVPAGVIYARTTRQGTRPGGYRFSVGLGTGMAVAVAIAIPLSELGGYHGAGAYAIPVGLALGSILGLHLHFRSR